MAPPASWLLKLDSINSKDDSTFEVPKAAGGYKKPRAHPVPKSVQSTMGLVTVPVYLAACAAYLAASTAYLAAFSEAVEANSLYGSVDSASDSNGTRKGFGSFRRQAREYTPPGPSAGQGQYLAPPVGQQSGGSYAAPMGPAPVYAAPPQPSYGSPGPVMMHGGYGVPSHYAIPPIVMGSSGGYSDYGDDGGGGGGHDYKELIGLLGLGGLKGLKGVKGVKAVKALKGLGLLALSPILLPLLPLLLLLPLLPLLLLLLIPVPVITIPGGRRRRSLQGQRSIFEETMNSIVSHLPQGLSNVPPAQLNECLDTFVCQTGDLVHRTVPSLVRPAAWLLTSLWPAEMHSKVAIFERAERCGERFKCRVKKLENLFTNVVFKESVKVRKRIQEKVGDRGRVGWREIVKIIFE